MTEPDLPRACSTVVREYLSVFRGVVLNGPRQAGKSTLLRALHRQLGGTLLNLDNEQLLQAAIADPVAFASTGTEPRYLDEVQRAGDPLIRAVKAEVDTTPTPGRYVLAGSTRFLTTPSLTESLAGRVAVVEVWPFSQGEFEGRFERFIDVSFDDPGSLRELGTPSADRFEYFLRVCRGGFPDPALMSSVRGRRAWFRSYVQAIAERDIREMARVNEPSAITSLLTYLASITSQEHNSVNTSNKTGLHRSTVNRYLELLQAVFLIHRLPAWSRNLTARVVKHAKLHLTDTGLASALLGVAPDSLAKPIAPARGPLIDLIGPSFTQGIVLHTGRQGGVSFGDRLVSVPIAALWETGG
jgi:uncharacterized protein